MDGTWGNSGDPFPIGDHHLRIPVVELRSLTPYLTRTRVDR